MAGSRDVVFVVLLADRIKNASGADKTRIVRTFHDGVRGRKGFEESKRRGLCYLIGRPSGHIVREIGLVDRVWGKPVDV